VQDLILHHYPLSPFSQKIRTMLGYTGLPWQSVITREMPPRPMVAALAGGYRKIPVAQVGADVFCDTRTIAAEIALRSGKPELARENCAPEVQAFIDETDLDVFFACVLLAGTGKMGRKVRESMSLLDLARFMWDRIGMGLKTSVKTVSPREAKPRLLKHLAAMEQRLQQPFLFGPQPCHADFSAYHSLWFIRELAGSALGDDFPRVIAWMGRMQAFGEGTRSEIHAQQALEAARQATPRAVGEEHRSDPLIGRQVSIAPTDYGQVPTTGVLVGVTPAQWIIAREEPELGRLHLHFPRQGFALVVQ